jgi:tRNA U34 2-thiouridine synthase MnmA/TrmU
MFNRFRGNIDTRLRFAPFFRRCSVSVERKYIWTNESCRDKDQSLPENGKKVVVAMSGGIDSAAVAYILKSAGFDCAGVFMKNWDSSDEQGSTACTYSKDLEDMQAVCARLNIPALEVNFIKDYWNDVFEPFIDAYQTGVITPNPDVGCNRAIKFAKLRHHAFDVLGADYMATGHYARLGFKRHDSIIVPTFGKSALLEQKEQMLSLLNNHPTLLRGVDPVKDQSYFLSMTSSEQFRRVLFPLGHLLKSQVRDLVREPFQGLNVLSKAESMGVCFIGKRKFSQFLGQYISLTPGRFVDIDTGRVLGTHSGKELLTAGQGARIGGVSAKYFVVASDADACSSDGLVKSEGDVFVAKGTDHPSLFSNCLHVDRNEFSWVSGCVPGELLFEGGTLRGVQCKSRYNQNLQNCSVLRKDNRLIVSFELAQRSIAPGQICTLYDGDICLGGGTILARNVRTA